MALPITVDAYKDQFPFLLEMNEDELLVAGLIGTLIDFLNDNKHGAYLKGDLNYLDASKVRLYDENGNKLANPAPVALVKKK